MIYKEIKDRSNKDFKRLKGVEHKTFKQMVVVLEKEMPNFGRPPKLTRTDQLLMTLMYWREYRTQFHIAQSFGVSEASVCRTIRNIEDALIKSGQFRLSDKRCVAKLAGIAPVIGSRCTNRAAHLSGKRGFLSAIRG